MREASQAKRHGWKPRSPGVQVAVFGVIACLAPGLVFVSGLPALPMVVFWALAYGYLDNARGRWPWWVVGQWASLCSLFAVTLNLDGFEFYLVFGGLFAGTLMTIAWMLPIGLVAIHRFSWATRMPAGHGTPAETVTTVESDRTARSGSAGP
ncbi:hypothetical protein [Tessaracoccus sp.]